MRIEADQIDRTLRDQDAFLLDVRDAKEIEQLGTIEGYYNIPFSELEKRLGELPKDRPILTA